YRSIVRGEPAGSLDAWAVLAALAARTERIRLGTLVSPVTFRPPAVLAKNAVTVDHISNGRVELGIGAGWYEPEHDAYGLPFRTAGWRLDELERQLAEIHREWDDADEVQPKGVQRPRPPIIVGGSPKSTTPSSRPSRRHARAAPPSIAPPRRRGGGRSASRSCSAASSVATAPTRPSASRRGDR